MVSNVGDCDCGFTDPSEPTESIFTSFFAVNFTSISNQQFDDNFLPATYEIAATGSPYVRNFTASQVRLSDAGLELIVSPPSGSKSVPCAEVYTRSSTFFYGSYHAQYLVGDVPGTVTAFFYYRNDSSEVDIEYISAWNAPTLLYTVKPQIYLSDGSPSNHTYQRQSWNDTRAIFDQRFHDWAFVWLPEVVHYGLDGNYSSFLTTNVPQAPGRLALSHWSDGNPLYSLGPPTQTSTNAIPFVWAVYNDTNARPLACKKATSACTIVNGVLQHGTTLGGHGNDNPPSTGNIILANSACGQSRPLAPDSLIPVLLLFWCLCWRWLR